MPKRRDLNHATIRDGLRKLGFHVEDTADLGHGFPDLLANKKNREGTAVLLEVKMPGEKLTPAEIIFHQLYPGPIAIVYSLEDAIRALK